MLPSLAVRESVVISSICCSKEPNTRFTFTFLNNVLASKLNRSFFYVYYTRFVDVNKFIISLLYPTNQHFLISTIKIKHTVL